MVSEGGPARFEAADLTDARAARSMAAKAADVNMPVNNGGLGIPAPGSIWMPRRRMRSSRSTSVPDTCWSPRSRRGWPSAGKAASSMSAGVGGLTGRDSLSRPPAAEPMRVSGEPAPHLSTESRLPNSAEYGTEGGGVAPGRRFTDCNCATWKRPWAGVRTEAHRPREPRSRPTGSSAKVDGFRGPLAFHAKDATAGARGGRRSGPPWCLVPRSLPGFEQSLAPDVRPGHRL